MPLATAGPPPFNVEAVMYSSIGIIVLTGVSVAAVLKVLIVRRLGVPAASVPARNLVTGTAAEGLLLLAALYGLQIPVETGASMLALLLVGFFAGAGAANLMALRAQPATARWNRAWRVVVVTSIYPVIQTAVALVAGPPLGSLLVRLFP